MSGLTHPACYCETVNRSNWLVVVAACVLGMTLAVLGGQAAVGQQSVPRTVDSAQSDDDNGSVGGFAGRIWGPGVLAAFLTSAALLWNDRRKAKDELRRVRVARVTTLEDALEEFAVSYGGVLDAVSRNEDLAPMRLSFFRAGLVLEAKSVVVDPALRSEIRKLRNDAANVFQDARSAADRTRIFDRVSHVMEELDSTLVAEAGLRQWRLPRRRERSPQGV